ncbi:transferrin-binding protein-like solute binding protein [Ascidiaceihabitans sp.]|nr:transferrin-binding protein-like solute binding protein [Ascidiaceihabitans sp.]
MQKAVIGSILTLAVSGCGGGGGSMSNQPAYGLNILQQSTDGVALVRNYDGSGSEKMVGFGSVTAIQTARSGSTSGWTSISEYQNGNYYEFIRSTVMSNGGDLTIEGSGINLNNSGTEYVSMFVGETDEGVALMVTGTPATQLPTGNYSYEGSAVLVDSTTAESSVEGGTFAMNVNFDNKTGSITGASENLIFTENQITINTSNGEFSGSSGTIGQRSGVKLPASLEGNFYGSNATGVGGVTTSDLSVNGGYVAIFRSE